MHGLGGGLPRRQRRRLPHRRLVRRVAAGGRQPDAGAGAARRRAAGGRRRAGPRRADGVPAVPAAVLRPARRAGAVLQQPTSRPPRRWRRSRRCWTPRPTCRSRPRRWRCRRRCAASCEFDRVAVRVPARPGPDGAAGVRPAGAGRADRGAGRGDRGGQVDAGQAGGPVLRPDRRRGPARRRRPARRGRRRPPHGAGDDHAGGVPVLRVGGRQHRDGPAAARGRAEVGPRPRWWAPGRSSRRCPTGFDTDVRKRGGRLSAGQRQLVSLARVVLADPAVVLLDEATSSLDVPSERAVQAALETVLAGRTALIIAHRLSTVLDRRPRAGDGRRPDRARTAAPSELMTGTRRVRRPARRLAGEPGVTPGPARHLLRPGGSPLRDRAPHVVRPSRPRPAITAGGATGAAPPGRLIAVAGPGAAPGTAPRPEPAISALWGYGCCASPAGDHGLWGHGCGALPDWLVAVAGPGAAPGPAPRPRPAITAWWAGVGVASELA